MINSYALTLVLKPDLDEKARKEILDPITKRFGKLVSEELWGVRDLAYPIKKNKKGWYAHYLFEAESEVAPALDKALKLEEDLLRYLLVRV